MSMRLDRYLSEAGFGTRSEVKKYIAKGRVTVDGKIEKNAAAKVEAQEAQVCIDGEVVQYAAFEYFMLHKPAGVISASRADLRDPDTRCVVDLIEDAVRSDLFPAGRLDKDTEGLLLITNDGALAHRLLSPKHHVDKTYYVRLDGVLSDAAIGRLCAGVDIGDEKPTLPCRIVRADASDAPAVNTAGNAAETEQEKNETVSSNAAQSACLITIHEGRFHQIKRMFETEGLTVLYLKRLSMGSLRLDEGLARGASRRLTNEELAALQASTG